MGKSRRHSRTVSSHHLGPVLRITVSPYARKKVFKPVRRVVSATGGNTKIRLTPAPLRLDPMFVTAGRFQDSSRRPIGANVRTIYRSGHVQCGPLSPVEASVLRVVTDNRASREVATFPRSCVAVVAGVAAFRIAHDSISGDSPRKLDFAIVVGCGASIQCRICCGTSQRIREPRCGRECKRDTLRRLQYKLTRGEDCFTFAGCD